MDIIIESTLFYETCSSASIFAYGQTSSGKTYTMSGITEYTVADIYEYLDKVTFGTYNGVCYFQLMMFLGFNLFLTNNIYECSTMKESLL